MTLIPNPKKPFSDGLIQFVERAVTAPSADNSQPWEFAVDQDKIVCRYQHTGNTQDPFGANGHGTIIAAGALHQNIDDLLSCYELPASNVTYQPEWKISFLAPPTQVSSNDSISALLNRHTNRHPFASISPLATEGLPPSPFGKSRLTRLHKKSDINTISEAVRLCSEARFNSQDLHEWLFSSLRWTPETVNQGDGLDLKTIALPPGGRQFMSFIAPWTRMRFLNRFGMYKALAIADSQPVKQASCMLAIVGGKAVDEIWEAGQHLQQIWIELNRRGLAVHPYYAVTDLSNRLESGRLNTHWTKQVANVQKQMVELLRLEKNEQLHMLLRVGLPTIQPVRSKRKQTLEFLKQGIQM